MTRTFLVPIVISGTGTPAVLSGVRFNSYDTVAGFTQNNIQNLSNSANASADWVASADTGTDTVGFVDWGINCSGTPAAWWTVNGSLDGYGYCAGGNLAIGTDTAGKVLSLFTGGTLAANIRAQVSDTAFTFLVPLVVNASQGIQINDGVPVTPTTKLYQVGGLLFWDSKSLGGHLHTLLTPAYSATITVTPVSNTSHVRVALTGPATINMAASGYDGQKVTLELAQDAAGGRVVSLGTGFQYGSDITSFTQTTASNTADIVGLIYKTSLSKWMVVAIAHGY